MAVSKRTLHATKTRNNTTKKQQPNTDGHESSPTQKAATDKAGNDTEQRTSTESHGSPTTKPQARDGEERYSVEQKHASPRSPSAPPSSPEPNDKRSFQQLVHDYGSDMLSLNALFHAQ